MLRRAGGSVKVFASMIVYLLRRTLSSVKSAAGSRLKRFSVNSSRLWMKCVY